MKLKKLLGALKHPKIFGDETLDVTELAYHTSEVTPGCCFVAIRGFKSDGHQFVSEAIAKGAKVVVVEKELALSEPITKVVVKDTRDCLARLSHLLCGEPTKQLCLVGITGTNGKTTTAGLIESIWLSAGIPSGLLSTVGYRWKEFSKEAPRTTPESWDLQKMFRSMVQEGVKHCVMEVTSHAIDLKRVVGCHFDGAVFTNLSEDHLDYHQTMERYFACKARLFRERLVVSEKKSIWAVLNWDDPYGKTLASGLPAKLWRYSTQEGSGVEIALRRVSLGWQCMTMEVHTPLGNLLLTSELIGMFNVSNILAAVAAAMAMGIPLKYIQQGVAHFKGIPGRLERLGNKKFEVFVDYAHTPDALQKVLTALRELKPKRLLTLFGCGGNRDRFKRPLMGEMAERLSDAVVVTSDNPRDEEPRAILQDILKGIKNPLSVIVMEDRKEAIRKILELARPGDCVLIAGKGHETYQEVKGMKHPFDDRVVAGEILNGI